MEYCRKNHLSHKVLLLADNPRAHLATLDQTHENVKVVFLPPNAISLLQPMDQGAISSFTAYYLPRTFTQLVEGLDNIMALYKDRQLTKKSRRILIFSRLLKICTMKRISRKIWPKAVEPFCGIDFDGGSENRNKLEALIKSMKRIYLVSVFNNSMLQFCYRHT